MNKPHKHADKMLQYAQDAQETETPWERWELSDGGNSIFRQARVPILWLDCREYRRKQKTIKINGFDVPEPMRKEPKLDGEYFIASIQGIYCGLWMGRPNEKEMLSFGVLHPTREAAELHAKALLSFTQTNK